MKGDQRNIYPGGNTPRGFYSYYNYILPQRKAEKIYCIKGGPGSGKSTLMKKTGEYFLEKGEDVDYLWCSSDPDSLDGILLPDRGVAVIDGTAPHVTDPVNPGAVDKIINLGMFWDEEKLRNSRNEIIACSERMTIMFSFAYNYLEIASMHYSFIEKLMDELTDEEMIIRISEELCRQVRSGKEKDGRIGSVKKMFASAITPRGLKNGLNSLCGTLEKIITLELPVGFRSEKILRPAADKLVREGCNIEEYYCPVDPLNKLEHIIMPSEKTGIFTCNKYHYTDRSDELFSLKIAEDSADNNMKYCIIQEQKAEAENNIMKAVEMLKNAKREHDNLEKYYIDAMDFEGIESVFSRIVYEIEEVKHRK